MDKTRSSSMLEGSIVRALLIFALPILAGTFVQQLYNTADSIIVGKFVNALALAAVGASGSITFGITYFFQGLTNGSTVVISQFYGAKEHERVKLAVSTSMWIGILCGLLFMLVFFPLTRWLLVITSTSAEIIELANLYFQIIIGGLLGVTIYNSGTAILRALGDSKSPLYYLVFASLLNVVLDLLFVCVFKWSVAGAGFATILSQYLSALLVMIKLMRLDPMYSLDLRHLRFDGETAMRMIRIGIGSGIQNGVVSFACILLQSQVNVFGTYATGGYTVGTRITDFLYMPGGAFGMAATTFVGQNLGARQYDRVKQCAKISQWLNFVSTLAFGVGIHLLCTPLISMFTDEPQVMEVAASMIHIISIPSCLWGFLQIFASVITGAGDSIKPMLITLLNLCVIRLLWIYGTVGIWPSVDTVFLGFPISWITGVLCMFVLYMKYPWFEKAKANIEDYYLARELAQKEAK